MDFICFKFQGVTIFGWVQLLCETNILACIT